MSMMVESLSHLSDHDLLATVARAAQRERHAIVELIAALMEVDVRRLYLGQGCSSLFTFCAQVLRLSEHAAYDRIAAARLAVRFPIVLNLLADGALNLATVCLLAPHLTADNHERVLEDARHKSKRDVEHLVAQLAPKPDAKPMVRKVPEPARLAAQAVATTTERTPGESLPTVVLPTPASLRTRAEVRELAPERFKIQFTMGRDACSRGVGGLRRGENSCCAGARVAVAQQFAWEKLRVACWRCGNLARTGPRT